MTRKVTPYHRLPRSIRAYTFQRKDRCMSNWKIAPGEQLCAICGCEIKDGQAWMGVQSQAVAPEICHVDCEVRSYATEWSQNERQ